MKFLKKLKALNLVRALIDQSPIGTEIRYNVLDTTHKSYFKKNKDN